MDNKIKETILEYKSSNNNDLKSAISVLSEEYEQTKELIIKLSYHLDAIENSYNKLVKEYKNRNIV
jgi:hypothetical protein